MVEKHQSPLARDSDGTSMPNKARRRSSVSRASRGCCVIGKKISPHCHRDLFIPPTFALRQCYGGQCIPHSSFITAHCSLNNSLFPINILFIIRSPLNTPSRRFRHEPLSVAKDKSTRNDRVFEISRVLDIGDVFLDP